MLFGATPAIKPSRKILLCGSQYGANYLPALYRTRHLQLSAILAKGSRHSTILAHQAGVPLITEINQLAEVPDAAIVALGGEVGFKIASELLQRKIPVLLEHPVRVNHIKTLLEVSGSYSTKLHINSHFSELPPALEFIQVCQNLNHLSQALIVNIACNSRTLFSALDILFQAFNGVEIDSPLVQSINDGYKLIRFNLGETPCVLTYQHWRYEQDDSKDAPLGHQICVVYSQGTAILPNTYGPFYWYPLLAAAPGSTSLYSNNYGDSGKIVSPNQAEIIRWRQLANINALEHLLYPPDVMHCAQSKEYLTSLCGHWEMLYELVSHQVVDPRVTQLTDEFLSVADILNE